MDNMGIINKDTQDELINKILQKKEARWRRLIEGDELLQNINFKDLIFGYWNCSTSPTFCCIYQKNKNEHNGHGVCLFCGLVAG